MGETSFPTDTPVPTPRPVGAEVRTGSDNYQDLLAHVVRGSRQRAGDLSAGDEIARARLRPTIEQVARSVGSLPVGVTPERLTRDALAELAGNGAFEAIFEDGAVTTAVVDPSGHVAVGRGTSATGSGLCFSDPDAAKECLERLLRAHGSTLEGRSIVRVTLGDGVRITAAQSPLTTSGLVVVLEKPQRTSLSELSSAGGVSVQVAQALAQAVAARRNIAVVGPCAAVRETVLAALLGAVPAGDRVTVIAAHAGLGAGRRETLALRAGEHWGEALGLARAARAPRCFVAESNAVSASAFVGELVSGAEGWVIGVEAPTGTLGLARLASLGVQEPWLTRTDAAERLYAGHVLVVETAPTADGAPRITVIGEARPDGSIARIEA